jgi:hypothetical protein
MPLIRSSFSEGQTSDDHRAPHREYGEVIRWWKGYGRAGEAMGPNGETAGPNGVLYIEQLIAPEVRVRIISAQQQMQTVQFATISVGDATISVMPDEIELAPGDIIVRTDPIRAMIARIVLEPSGAAIDRLPYGLIASVSNVFTAAGPLLADAYAVHETGIEWDAPPTSPVLIDCHHFPAFEFTGLVNKIPPKGSDGKLLPAVGGLRLLKPGEDFLKGL